MSISICEIVLHRFFLPKYIKCKAYSKILFALICGTQSYISYIYEYKYKTYNRHNMQMCMLVYSFVKCSDTNSKDIHIWGASAHFKHYTLGGSVHIVYSNTRIPHTQTHLLCNTKLLHQRLRWPYRIFTTNLIAHVHSYKKPECLSVVLHDMSVCVSLRGERSQKLWKHYFPFFIFI